MRIQFNSDKAGKPDDIITFLTEFPARINETDLIDFAEIIDAQNRMSEFSEAQQDILYSYSWRVEYIDWSIDKDGIFQKVWLTGE